MGSLLLSAAAFWRSNRDAGSKERDDILSLPDRHRRLWWSELSKHPELLRIFQTDVDVQKMPPTAIEEVFINEQFIVYMSGWRFAKNGGTPTLNDVAKDVKWFFSLPLPSAVWEKTKTLKPPEFMEFVEGAVTGDS